MASRLLEISLPFSIASLLEDTSRATEASEIFSGPGRGHALSSWDEQVAFISKWGLCEIRAHVEAR
jgi:hypothetical protein